MTDLCFIGELDAVEIAFGDGSPEYWTLWWELRDRSEGKCLFAEGHAGPHHWTPGDQIILRLREPGIAT